MKKIELRHTNGNINYTMDPVVRLSDGDMIHIFKKGGSPFLKEGVYTVSIGLKRCGECPFYIGLNGYGLCGVLRVYSRKSVPLCATDARSNYQLRSYKFKPIDTILENL